MPLSSVWAGDAVNRHLESVCGVGTPHLYCSTTGVDALPPAPRRRRRRPHAHHRPDGQRQVDPARHAGARVAQVPARPGHRLRQGPKRARRDARRRRDLLRAGQGDGARRLSAARRHRPAGRARLGRAVRRDAARRAGRRGRSPDADRHRRDAREPRRRPARAADADAPRDAARIAAAGAPRCAAALHARGQLRPDLRRRPRTTCRPERRLDDDRDGAPHGHGPGGRPSGARVPLSPGRSSSSTGGRRCSSWTRRGSFSATRSSRRACKAWLKTLRKKNVYVVFATQEVADATSKPELLSTILSACHTKIFLPDDEALTPAMAQAYQAVGLTTAEVHILAKAQKKRDYYYRSVKGRRLFELGLGPAALASSARRASTTSAFLDELVAHARPARLRARPARAPRRRVGRRPSCGRIADLDGAEPRRRRATVPMTEGALAELLSLATSVRQRRGRPRVPCPPPEPRTDPQPSYGARGPHERAHSTQDPLGRARVRRLRGARYARDARRGGPLRRRRRRAPRHPHAVDLERH